MYDIEQIQDILTKEDILDKPYCCTINSIDEEGQTKLLEDAQKVIRYNKDFLPVIIDSYGGEVYSALGMYDILRSFGCEVITIVIGKAMSAGAILFSAGDYRYISENSTVMIHQVTSITYGKTEEVVNESDETTRINDILFALLDKRSNNKKGYWKRLLKENKYTDIFLTAKDTLKHGLATKIGLPEFGVAPPEKVRRWENPDT